MKPATKDLSFGYSRAEVVGTLVSIIFIWGLTIWLLWEATLRILNPQEVIGFTMLIVAVMGLGFNLIQMKILHSGDGHYHLGGSHDHGHDHEHDHDHGPKKHKHEEGHSHNHPHKKEGGAHKHEHDHESGHSHSKTGREHNKIHNDEIKEPLISH